MKHSRAALGVLKNRYISVLKKCALINTAFLLMVPPAAAVDVDWDSFDSALAGNDGTINLTGDIKRNDNWFSSDTGINTPRGTSIVINGQRQTLDGSYTGIVGRTYYTDPITIVASQTLTIDNLIETGFSTFLNNSGTVNINNSTIQNNRNDNEDTGAGIYNDGGTVNVVSSVFADNYVTGAGAAINNKNGHIVIEDSRFSGNESATNGGAIDTWNNNGVSATIINSIFENNHANPDLDVDDGEIKYTYTGGAISNGGGTINILAVDSEHSTNSTNGNTVFTGNYVGDGDERVSNALANVGTVNLNANVGHSIIFNDKIDYRNDSTDRANHIININQDDVSVQDAAGKDIALTNDGTIEINNTVSNQTVNLYNGTLKFGHYDGGEDWQKGIGGLDNASTDFNIHGGTISLQDGVGRYEADSGPVNGGPVQWGQTATLHSDFNLAIDAITEGKENGHDVGADMFQTGSLKDDSEGNDHKIILSDINLGANTKYNGTAVTLDSAVWDKIVADENTKLQSTAEGFANKNHLTAWNKDTGILKVGAFTLQDAVAETSGERHYTLNSTENVTEDLGEMLDTGSLTIAGNGKDIIANSTTPDRLGGITVGTGNTLEINDVAAMQGFDTALNVTDGTVSVNNSGLTGNTTALNVTGGTVSLDNSDITNNTTGLSVSDGSVTLTDSNITDNTTGLTVAGGTVNINASAGDSAESLNTVAIDNTNDIANNNGTINFNAFANAVIEVADNVIRAVGNTVNGILNINMAENASGTVNLANVDGQTVNINKGTVTMDKATGSDVNITKGDIDIAAVDNSTVDVADGTANFNDNITSSTLTLNGGTNTIADDTTVSDSKITVATGATANIAADLDDSDITINDTAGNTTISGDVTNGSVVTANADTTISGAVSDSTVNANGGKITISAAVNDSTLSVGTNGALEVAATGNISGSTVNTAGTTTINGNVEESSQLDVTGGTTTIAGIVSDSDVNVSGGTANLQGNVIGTELNQSGGTLNLGTEGKEISLAGSTLNSGKANLIADAVTGGADGAFTIAEKAALNTAQNATIAASIKGSGTINNTGGSLTFATTDGTNDGATGAEFTGTINATAGTINLDADYRLNTGANINLSNSTLDYKAVNKDTLSNDTLFDLTLNGNATANITGTGRDSSEITLADKFWTMGENTTGNTLNFNDANYIFADGFTTGDDILNFNNAGLTFEQSGQNYGNIAVNNSILNLSDRNAGDTYTFETLNATGTNNFSVDVDLYLDDASSNPIADKIIVNSSNGGKLTLTELFITNDNGVIGQVEGGKNIQLIQNADGASNPLQLEVKEGVEILSWATNVYEYGVTSASSDGKIIDSINIAEDGPSSTDTLRDLNMYGGAAGYNNRGFSFVIDESNPEESNKYNIYRDLDTTTEGTFTVLGRYDEHGHKSILSGELKELIVNADSKRLEKQDDGTYTYYKADGTVDKSGLTSEQVKEILEEQNLIGHSIEVGAMGNASGTNLADTHGSMFELVNDTNLKINDVSIEEAKRYDYDDIKHGAAIYANNEKAEVTLENTDFKNNSVEGGNGGAIANIKSAVFYIANAIFSGNKASANGGAIYNAEGAEMTIAANSVTSGEGDNAVTTPGKVQFSNNAATLGGAIYNAGTLNMTTSGEGSSIIVDAGTKTASNDIYNTGSLKLNGNITINSAVTAAVDENGKATAGTLNFADGSLTLGKDASITQKNMSIAEDLELAVNADQLKISEALNNAGTLTFTGGTNTSAITGEGTLNITGEVTNNATIGQDALTIAATTGSLATNAGNLILADNSITNNGLLTFTGGTNANNISGTGVLNITD